MKLTASTSISKVKKATTILVLVLWGLVACSHVDTRVRISPTDAAIPSTITITPFPHDQPMPLYPDAVASFEQGRRLSQEGKFDAAIRSYKMSLIVSPLVVYEKVAD